MNNLSGLKVCKFGGTSLATADQIRKVCDIILSDPKRRIIVLSAPGKRHAQDTKVTDLLIACAQAKFFGDSQELENAIELVVSRFLEIINDLGIGSSVDGPDIKRRLWSRLENSIQPRDRFVDGVKALGEEFCTRLVAGYLSAQGHEAHFVDPKYIGLLLSDEAGNARVLPQTYENLASLRKSSGLSLVPGFYGYTLSGVAVTFPRGGSDITGAIVAAAVKADLYENFTDVNGVLSAHPGIVENPAPISALTYAEMRELSYSGFGVFHDEALEPVYHAGIPVRIANTNNPEAPGTLIVPARQALPNKPVVGIAANTGFCTIFVSKYMMNREVGFGRRLLEILENEGLSYEHAPSGIDTISVILRRAEFEGKEQKIIDRIKFELQPDAVSVDRDLALVMVVGESMRYAIGLASRATTALAHAGVNIEMLNQGSSEISMMFGIRGQDVEVAVKALYQEFFGD